MSLCAVMKLRLLGTSQSPAEGHSFLGQTVHIQMCVYIYIVCIMYIL